MTSEEYKKLSIHEFDAAAAKFDDNDPSVYNLCRKDYPDLLAELEKEPFASVLDCGCGTGAMLELMSKAHPEAVFTGIDLSNNMIETAKKRNLNNVTFMVGDYENLPFDENSFDVLLCSMSFHHYPQPQKFFASVFRVLRPGGRLILRDMTAGWPLIWLVNHVEIPLANHLLHKGDVKMYGRKDIEVFCSSSGLKLRSFEQRKGLRLHAVCQKQP